MERTFKCPHCRTQVTCLGSAAGHKCPSNKSLWTQFEEIASDDD